MVSLFILKIIYLQIIYKQCNLEQVRLIPTLFQAPLHFLTHLKTINKVASISLLAITRAQKPLVS